MTPFQTVQYLVREMGWDIDRAVEYVKKIKRLFPWGKVYKLEKVTCDDCEYAEESLVYDSLWCKKFRYEVSGGTPACSEFKRKKEGF